MAQQKKIGNSDKSITAVEWLVRKLSTELIGEIPLHRWDEIRETVQKSKQMEKEQIIMSHVHNRCLNNKTYGCTTKAFEDAEQYYNETYTKLLNN